MQVGVHEHDRSPEAASVIARLTEVIVFPSPGDALVIMIERGKRAFRAGGGQHGAERAVALPRGGRKLRPADEIALRRLGGESWDASEDRQPLLELQLLLAADARVRDLEEQRDAAAE